MTKKQLLIVLVYNNNTVCNLGTMPGNTTSVCLNSNRLWIKSALDSSAPKSLNSSKTSSTCSWIMTGGWKRVQLSEYNLLLFLIVCIFWCLTGISNFMCIYSIYHKILFSILKIFHNILMCIKYMGILWNNYPLSHLFIFTFVSSVWLLLFFCCLSQVQGVCRLWILYQQSRKS